MNSPDFHVHFTPTYGSWLNLVERWFAFMSRIKAFRIQIVFGVALDVWRMIGAALDSIAELPELRFQFVLINGSPHGLDPEELIRLQRTGLAGVIFGHVEHDHVCVQVRSGVAVYRTRGVVLERGGNPFAGGLRSEVAAHPRLNIMFDFIQSRS